MFENLNSHDLATVLVTKDICWTVVATATVSGIVTFLVAAAVCWAIVYKK